MWASDRFKMSYGSYCISHGNVQNGVNMFSKVSCCFELMLMAFLLITLTPETKVNEPNLEIRVNILRTDSSPRWANSLTELLKVA